MSVAIVDYGSGNLMSAAKAFERSARASNYPGAVSVTAEPEIVAKADRLVLPGVGAFADCAAGLKAIPGLTEALEEAVRRKGRPFLGICVGMQLMASRGHEKTVTAGLDWIGGDVRRIKPSDSTLKVPQMGWNTLDLCRDHPVLSGIRTGETGLHAYFVHSYHVVAAEPGDLVATTPYGSPITAVIARDSMIGTQFHPEKSQRLGLTLISNFLRWRP